MSRLPLPRVQPLGWCLGLLLLLLSFAPGVQAHRHSCHRWHRCPSDSGSYVCGDLGQCAQCPDNAYCLGGQPRRSSAVPASPALPGPAPAPQPAVESESSRTSHRATLTGTVVGLSDGDTLDVLREGTAVRIRLHSIDTPEKAQAFGTRARQFSSELVFQKHVIVQVKDTDRYGRLVGEVVLPDGRSLHHELVKAGLARWSRPYAPHDTRLAQLEAEARAAQRGLGADAAPVPPWAWRKARAVR